MAMTKEERTAPEGKFRVIGVDTFDRTDWVDKDCDSLEAARKHASERTWGKEMLKMYVYDDKGDTKACHGTF